MTKSCGTCDRTTPYDMSDLIGVWFYCRAAIPHWVYRGSKDNVVSAESGTACPCYKPKLGLCLYYMHDNHRFDKLPNDVDSALLNLAQNLDGGRGTLFANWVRSGIREASVIPALDQCADWAQFLDEARVWLELALASKPIEG